MQNICPVANWAVQALLHASQESLQRECSVSLDSAAFHAAVFLDSIEGKKPYPTFSASGSEEQIVLLLSIALNSSGPMALFLRSVPLACHYLFIHVCRGPLFLSICSIIQQHLLVAHPAPTAHPSSELTLTGVRMRLGGCRS